MVTKMTMTPSELLENFKEQQKTAMDNVRQLEQQLTQQKELYVKLQGAIEGIELLEGKQEETPVVDPVEVAMS